MGEAKRRSVYREHCRQETVWMAIDRAQTEIVTKAKHSEAAKRAAATRKVNKESRALRSIRIAMEDIHSVL